MKTHISALIFATSICLFTIAHSTPDEGRKSSLSEAISAFNKGSLTDSIGAKQPPLTMDEVVAAVLLWERSVDTPVSDELLTSFKQIAESRTLPGNATFERLTGVDPGHSHVFDVWYVRIRMEREDGSSFGFPIRSQVVGSRTVAEELKRWKQTNDEETVGRWVGGHRILNRKKELETRIERFSQGQK